MRRSIFLPLVLVYVATAGFSTASAQVTIVEKQDNQHPTVYKMTVSPAAEPRPALKYRFLVPPVDQIHANAATFYYKSMVMEEPRDYLRELSMEPLVNDVDAWLEMPLDKLPKQEIKTKASLVTFADTFWIEPLRQASHCDYCNWEDPIREHGVSTLLPQAQKMRGVARALALKTRLQIADGELEEALNTLQLGYGLSRNMSRAPSLVQVLIGIAVQKELDSQTLTFIASDNSPNLYWALTDLANQAINIREALSYEAKFWEFSVHEIAQLNDRTMTPEAALKLAKQIPNFTDRGGFQNVAQIFLWAAVLEPEARKYLLANGYTADKLDTMPVLQVALLYRWKQFEIVRDNCFKFLDLPDDELRDAIARSDDAVRAATARNEGAPFTQLLPAVGALNNSRLRSIQDTNMLRLVEALRIYAAEHGHWPEKLDDIKSVPIPNDPYTDKPFEYSLAEGIAKLSAPSNYRGGQYSGGSGEQRYELTLRPSKGQ